MIDTVFEPRPPIRTAQRYIFDISDLIRLAHVRKLASQAPGSPSRTLLNLAYHASAMRPDATKVGYFDNINMRYYELPNHELLSNFDTLRAQIKKSVDFKRQFKVWKYNKFTVPYYYHIVKRGIAHCHAKWINNSNSQARDASAEILNFRKGDTIVCLGSSWDSLDLFRYFGTEDILHPGIVDLAVLVNDMAPVQMKAAGALSSLHFEHWLHQICRLDAKVLVNSNSTAHELRDWSRKHDYCDLQIGQFPLGDEPLPTGKTSIRGDICALINERYVLMAGAISGAKNGGNLIRAWRILAERLPEGELPLLVIAGQEGRSSLMTCGLDPATVPTSNIVFITHPNDSELGRLYANCLFSVFPSLYEGWALPVRESLWHGKLCATSNRSSMPEAGGGDCEYFDADDPRDIAKTLGRLLTDPIYLAARTRGVDRTRLRTWAQAADAMLATLDEMAAPQPSTAEADVHLQIAPQQVQRTPIHPS